VKQGATIAIANKHGETPLSKARPRLRKKLEGKDGSMSIFGLGCATQYCVCVVVHSDGRGIWAEPYDSTSQE